MRVILYMQGKTSELNFLAQSLAGPLQSYYNKLVSCETSIIDM